MFCAQCGSSISGGATSCPACGVPVSVSPTGTDRITVDVPGDSNPSDHRAVGPTTHTWAMDPSGSAPRAKGFLASLFDFEFSNFVTQGVLRVVYFLVTILYSIGALALLIMCLASGQPVMVLGGLIVVPLLYVLYLAMARVWTEMIMVLFVIGSDLRAVRDSLEGANRPTEH